MIKNLIAQKQATQYYFQYTLDDTKKQSDGSYDPTYIREYTYVVTPPMGIADNDYVAMMQRELPLLCQSELDAMTAPAPAPTPLTGF